MNDTLQPGKNEIGFIKNALALALPIAFQNLLTSCATLIDTVMVLRLGSNAATAAMGVASRFSFLLNVICFGFASGCASLLSQYWGKKDRRGICAAFGLVLCVSMGFGMLYAAALFLFPQSLAGIFVDDAVTASLAGSYLKVFSIGVPFVVFSQIMCISLRSVERVFIPLISSAASVVVNTAMNFCFIEGRFGFPRLGVQGAAIGSVAGYIVQTMILLFFLLFRNTPLSGRRADYFSFRKPFVVKYFKVALPTLLNETMWAVGANIYTMILARQGTENYAGYTLYDTVQQIFFVFFVGICSACSVMTGMQVGRGDRDGAYRVAKRFAVLTPVMGVILGGILILIRTPLLRCLPIETEGARAVASGCLLFYGFWIAMRMIPYTMICGIFRAGGDTRSGCFFDLFGLYALGIPALFITAQFIRPSNFVVLVAVMFMAEDIVKGILCVRHFRSKKWIKQLTANEEFT